MPTKFDLRRSVAGTPFTVELGKRLFDRGQNNRVPQGWKGFSVSRLKGREPADTMEMSALASDATLSVFLGSSIWPPSCVSAMISAVSGLDANA